MSTAFPINGADAAPRLIAYIRGFNQQSRSAGKDLFSQGKVRKIELSDDQTVLAEVEETALYQVQLTRLGTTWWNDCSCALGGSCKHVVAAALAWEMQLTGSASPLPEVDETTKAPPAKPANFRAEWQPILEQKLGRPLTAQEGTFLGKISQLFNTFKQSGVLWPSELARVGLQTKEARAALSSRAYEGWWVTPPATPLELWQYIAYDFQNSGIPVPPFMAPLTDLASVRPSIEAALRRQATETWIGRFKASTALYSSSQHTPSRQFLDLRIQVVGQKISLQTRAAEEGPWKIISGSAFERLCEEDTIARIDASLPVLACLMLVRAYHQDEYGGLARSGIVEPRLLNQILQHPRARECVTGADGLPFRFHDQPLVWRVLPAATAGDYTMVLTLEGSDVPLERLLPLPGKPDLYLGDELVYRGPPPFAQPGETAPREAIEHPETLEQLQTFGTQLPPQLQSRIESIPLRLRFEWELEEPDIFFVKLVAHADRPRIQKVWTGAGWVGSEPSQPASDQVSDGKGKVKVFGYTKQDHALSALRELELSYQVYRSAWKGRVTQAFPEMFTAWRARLPKELEVVVSGELASLLEDPIRATLDFNLIATKAHRDWFDLALGLRANDDTLSQEEIALLLKAKGKFVRLPGKGWRRLVVELDDAAKDVAGSIGLDPGALAQAGLMGEKHRFHLLQISQSKVAELLPERQAAQLRGRATVLVSPEPPALPAGLRAELRPYQAEGFHFLAFLSANRLGGVLADDMGLGKTLQTLTWLLWLFQSTPADQPKCALVVCPKSVMGNWETETARFTPGISVLRFTATMTGSRLPPTSDRPLIVVANYTQLRLHEKFFQDVQWSAVILDEGQFIKNPTSKVAQIARELPGEQRLVLTGTPIENRLLDLWSLFAFAVPGLLGTQANFRRQFPDTDPEAVSRLRLRVRHFLLRRTKGQVATDLPARTEEDVPIELEGDQLQLYQAELKNAQAQLLRVKSESQLDKARFNILASLLRLRQICCHPALVDPSFANQGSAKLDALMERLEELREEGHQVLVFSQFVEMLKIIKVQLEATEIPHLLLTGQTEDREELVKKFQSDRNCTVFLLSLKAAGFGLNLTAASYVILYDPWWNPAVEAQAIDRTHRIGQVNAVNAYRFVARGTVEEKIRALQKEKAALAGAVVQEESLSRLLDLDTLRQVLM